MSGNTQDEKVIPLEDFVQVKYPPSILPHRKGRVG